MTKETLTEISQKYGTPTYVFDTDILQNRAKEIRNLWGDKINLCYSIKANPFLIPAMLEVVDQLEVCSPGELLICEELHKRYEHKHLQGNDQKLVMNPVIQGLSDASTAKLPDSNPAILSYNRIVYSGVSKGKEDIQSAIRDGVGIFTAESIHQAELLEEGVNEALKQAQNGKNKSDKEVSHDIKEAFHSIKKASPDDRATETSIQQIPVLLRLAGGSQFGMSKEDLFYIIDNRDSIFPHLDIQGIHYFQGTQRKNKEFNKQKKELEMLHDLFIEAREQHGINLKKLEYGPGLPVPLFEGEDASDTLVPAREIADVLKSVTEWADLTVEMGRFFATECGYYLTKVMDTKQDGDKRYAILDGGIHHVSYLGQIMGMRVPVITRLGSAASTDSMQCEAAESSDVLNAPHRVENNHTEVQALAVTDRNKALTPPPQEWALCGSLCTTNDDLVRSYKTSQPLRIGEVLCFHNIGAYSVTEGIYLFLSRTLPQILLYNTAEGVRVARDFQETAPINTLH